MTVNGRPLKAARYKARNRATETSRFGQWATCCELASKRVKRGNLHSQQDQIGWCWRCSRCQRGGCLSVQVIARLEEWLSCVARRKQNPAYRSASIYFIPSFLVACLFCLFTWCVTGLWVLSCFVFLFLQYWSSSLCVTQLAFRIAHVLRHIWDSFSGCLQNLHHMCLEIWLCFVVITIQMLSQLF